jgi:intracellular multiplication protein IcmV
MPVRDVFKFSRKTFFNPSGWLDLNFLKFQHITLWRNLKALFVADKPERLETFEEAIERLGLNEKEIEATQNTYKNYALFFVFLGMLVLLYGFYLLFRYWTFTGWLLALVASLLFFGQAFRYDFWVLQMKHRKLGVTFEEWKQYRLGNKEISS